MNNMANHSDSTSFRAWIINHDDSRVFIVAYIGLAVILSAFVSLFWLVVVVGVHFVFEYIRQSHLNPGRSVLRRSFWELRLDLALIVFAMVIALYMEFVIGVAGLRLAPRLGRAVAAGSRGTARFTLWTRMIRAVLLSLDDAAQVARAVLYRKKANGASHENGREDGDSQKEAAPVAAVVAEQNGSGWSKGDYVIALFFGLSVLLLVLTPILTDHTFHSAFRAMLSEMYPFP